MNDSVSQNVAMYSANCYLSHNFIADSYYINIAMHVAIVLHVVFTDKQPLNSLHINHIVASYIVM